MKSLLKIVPNGPSNNIPALVQLMSWCRPDDKPLSDPIWSDSRRIYTTSLGLNELNRKYYVDIQYCHEKLILDLGDSNSCIISH